MKAWAGALVRPSQIARASGLCIKEVYRAIGDGELPFIDVASRDSKRSAYYVPREAAEAWIAGRVEQAFANQEQAQEKRRRFFRPRTA